MNSLDVWRICENLISMSTKRVALYVRVSADKGQTVENQLIDLRHAAERFGWTIVAVHRDEGISGAKGRDRRPGLDALLRGIARREYDIVAAWSVCRLGRSLAELKNETLAFQRGIALDISLLDIENGKASETPLDMQ